MLRGTQNLFLDMYEQPDLVKRLVEYCVEPLTDLVQMLLEAGADLTQTHCPVASREMISRKHYLEFVHPVHQALYSDWEQRIGLPVLFHICGDWNDRLDLVAEEGVSGVHIDRTDLARAKELFGPRVSIMGNVPSTDVMLLGTPEDVERESAACIATGGPGGGYLLGADCLLARDTPAENVKAMVRAAERSGSKERPWPTR
jgi:MtaA/CmuA family methyltransferase